MSPGISSSICKKRCGRCGVPKFLHEFHRDKTRRDGRHPYCAICQTSKAAKWCRENRERSNANVKAYRRRHPERIEEAHRSWRDRNPEKENAHRLANEALRKGVIIKPPRCTDCMARRVEMHHPDYREPLRVVWLCGRCHSRRHREEGRDA
jgi:hypothetical protein